MSADIQKLATDITFSTALWHVHYHVLAECRNKISPRFKLGFVLGY